MEPPEPKSRGIVRTAPRTRVLMPLILTAFIYLFMAGYELVGGKYPELLVEGNRGPSKPGLSQPLRLDYEVRNPLDAPIGTAQCTLTPVEIQVKLDCSKTAEGDQTQVGSSDWASGELHPTLVRRLDGGILRPGRLPPGYSGENSSRTYWLEKQDSGLLIKIETPDTSHSINLIYSTLVEEEWPWRLMG